MYIYICTYIYIIIHIYIYICYLLYFIYTIFYSTLYIYYVLLYILLYIIYYVLLYIYMILNIYIFLFIYLFNMLYIYFYYVICYIYIYIYLLYSILYTYMYMYIYTHYFYIYILYIYIYYIYTIYILYIYTLHIYIYIYMYVWVEQASTETQQMDLLVLPPWYDLARVSFPSPRSATWIPPTPSCPIVVFSESEPKLFPSIFHCSWVSVILNPNLSKLFPLVFPCFPFVFHPRGLLFPAASPLQAPPWPPRPWPRRRRGHAGGGASEEAQGARQEIHRDASVDRGRLGDFAAIAAVGHQLHGEKWMGYDGMIGEVLLWMGGVGGAILCVWFSSLCFVYGLAWAGTNWSGATAPRSWGFNPKRWPSRPCWGLTRLSNHQQATMTIRVSCLMFFDVFWRSQA